MKIYSEDELVFTAGARCMCGAGLAYPVDAGMHDCWDCSDILTGKATPKGQIGSLKHDSPFPFAFYSIISEKSPRANGQSTRNKPTDYDIYNLICAYIGKTRGNLFGTVTTYERLLNGDYRVYFNSKHTLIIDRKRMREMGVR